MQQLRKAVQCPEPARRTQEPGPTAACSTVVSAAAYASPALIDMSAVEAWPNSTRRPHTRWYADAKSSCTVLQGSRDSAQLRQGGGKHEGVQMHKAGAPAAGSRGLCLWCGDRQKEATKATALAALLFCSCCAYMPNHVWCGAGVIHEIQLEIQLDLQAASGCMPVFVRPFQCDCCQGNMLYSCCSACTSGARNLVLRNDLRVRLAYCMFCHLPVVTGPAVISIST
jgi:hypothetical protein